MTKNMATTKEKMFYGIVIFIVLCVGLVGIAAVWDFHTEQDRRISQFCEEHGGEFNGIGGCTFLDKDVKYFCKLTVSNGRIYFLGECDYLRIMTEASHA